ncbi:MAG: hypothetical protein JW821_07470 [Deltaproteobacteria bacterium]|nr:hypothetical protein [Deltaproteobacteria bacterium]
MKPTRSGLLCVCLAFALCCVPLSTPRSQEVPNQGRQGGDPSIVIHSNALELDNKKRIVTFEGEVEARSEDFTIYCEKMTASYLAPTGGPNQEKDKLSIDKIIAEGKVKIIRSEGGEATAGHAVFYQKDKKLVLTGNPVVRQGKDFVEGARITLFLEENRSIVEGADGQQVRAVLSSGPVKR